jgi:hypothetical protein
MFLSDYILNEDPTPDHGLKAPFFGVPGYRIVSTQFRHGAIAKLDADLLLLVCLTYTINVSYRKKRMDDGATSKISLGTKNSTGLESIGRQGGENEANSEG